MSMLLGLSLVAGIATVGFAADEKSEQKKEKKKKGKKSKKDNKKEG